MREEQKKRSRNLRPSRDKSTVLSFRNRFVSVTKHDRQSDGRQSGGGGIARIFKDHSRVRDFPGLSWIRVYIRQTDTLVIHRRETVIIRPIDEFPAFPLQVPKSVTDRCCRKMDA